MSCEDKDLTQLDKGQLEQNQEYHRREANRGAESNLLLNIGIFHVPFTYVDFCRVGHHQKRIQELNEALKSHS